MYKQSPIHIEKIHTELTKALSDIRISDNVKDIITSGYFDLAFEHFSSMLILAEGQKYGSALVLTRVIFEAFIKAQWVTEVCSYKKAEGIYRRTRDRFAEMAQLVKDLDDSFYCKNKTDNEEFGPMGIMVKEKWRELCDYTHNSMQAQVTKRVKNGLFIPTYTKEEVLSLLDFATGVMCLFAIYYFTKKELPQKANIFKKFILPNEYEEIDDEFLLHFVKNMTCEQCIEMSTKIPEWNNTDEFCVMCKEMKLRY